MTRGKLNFFWGKHKMVTLAIRDNNVIKHKIATLLFLDLIDIGVKRRLVIHYSR